MSTVVEIEHAIDALAPQDFDVLAAWFDQKRSERTDAALESAVAEGIFDHLAERALHAFESGKCTPLNELIRHS